jgi:hypothetical protein
VFCLVVKGREGKGREGGRGKRGMKRGRKRKRKRKRKREERREKREERREKREERREKREEEINSANLFSQLPILYLVRGFLKL